MNDDDLEQRFSELRRLDRARLPPFDPRARPRARVHPLYAVVPALAAAAVLLVWCGAANTSSAPASAVAASALPPARPPPRAVAASALPLDFLLESAPARVRLDADPIEGLRP